uniref:Putative ovule protein n=1 Tax=Solanum chacoense TaxID=4108 RepID=A0A0V0H6L6_SOLCH
MMVLLGHYLGQLFGHTTQRVNYHLGYPVNICYDHYATLAPLLQFHLNNCGDPFLQNTVDFHSKDFEVAVLDWFAQLWEIEKDQYWGYVTNGGTEGNLHGILLGRELLPGGEYYMHQKTLTTQFSKLQECTEWIQKQSTHQ